MIKKEKHILNINFMYEYYEDDITERYIGNLSTNVILDNDCFDIEPLEKIYVTPFKKYHQLEKENKELKERINKAIELMEKQIPIVKINLNMTNINTAASELLNYEKLLEMLKGE